MPTASKCSPVSNLLPARGKTAAPRSTKRPGASLAELVSRANQHSSGLRCRGATEDAEQGSGSYTCWISWSGQVHHSL